MGKAENGLGGEGVRQREGGAQNSEEALVKLVSSGDEGDSPQENLGVYNTPHATDFKEFCDLISI